MEKDIIMTCRGCGMSNPHNQRYKWPLAWDDTFKDYEIGTKLEKIPPKDRWGKATKAYKGTYICSQCDKLLNKNTMLEKPKPTSQRNLV